MEMMHRSVQATAITDERTAIGNGAPCAVHIERRQALRQPCDSLATEVVFSSCCSMWAGAIFLVAAGVDAAAIAAPAPRPLATCRLACRHMSPRVP